jgi:tetratricopeptide (TPR) repeat protein
MKRLVQFLVAIVALAVIASPVLAEKAAALFKEGMALKGQGKTDEAISKLEAAVQERATHVMAWASLGHLYKSKGEHEKAIRAYEQATSFVPKDATLWSNLGMAYYRADRKEDALVALEKACRLDPKNPDIHSNLGTIKRQMGKNKAAVRHLELAFKYKKDSVTANNLGIAYRVSNRFSDAEKIFLQAIQIDPRVAQYHFNLGVVYRRMEEIEKAIGAYQSAVHLDPKMSAAWYDLGHMRRLNHDNERAIHAFRTYFELTKASDPKSAEEAAAQIEALGGQVPKKRTTAPVKKRKGKSHR